MKIEEAIEWMEETIQDINELFDQCSTALQEEITEQKEVFELALTALRSMPEAGEPLSLEQLREMDGKPVWVEFIGHPDGTPIEPLWMLVNCRERTLVTDVEYVDWNFEGWFAYSYPPAHIDRSEWIEAENKELKERIVNWRKYMAPTREQAEKAWRGEWKPFAESAYGKQYKCPNCHTRTSSCSNFCPHCGAPMSDEAVQMVMERWKEALE